MQAKIPMITNARTMRVIIRKKAGTFTYHYNGIFPLEPVFFEISYLIAQLTNCTKYPEQDKKYSTCQIQRVIEHITEYSV